MTIKICLTMKATMHNVNILTFSLMYLLSLGVQWVCSQTHEGPTEMQHLKWWQRLLLLSCKGKGEIWEIPSSWFGWVPGTAKGVIKLDRKVKISAWDTVILNYFATICAQAPQAHLYSNLGLRQESWMGKSNRRVCYEILVSRWNHVGSHLHNEKRR